VYRRAPDEAEAILLGCNPPLIYRAIKLNVRLARWARALELAQSNKCHIDTVVAYRQRYLASIRRPETMQQFVTAAATFGQLDWAAIKAKKKADKEKEAAALLAATAAAAAKGGGSAGAAAGGGGGGAGGNTGPGAMPLSSSASSMAPSSTASALLSRSPPGGKGMAAGSAGQRAAAGGGGRGGNAYEGKGEDGFLG
jgi:hypothetical protein